MLSLQLKDLVKCCLTVENHEEVARLIFSYISLIKKEGLTKEYFDEQKTINKIRFDYHEKGKAMDFATHTVSDMQKYPIEDVFWGPFCWESFNAEIISSCLNCLTVENSR